MWGLWRRGTLLGSELTEWQFGCFEWLLRHTGGLDAFRRRRMAVPTSACFPTHGLRGHALAAALFDQVRTHAGMAQWPCVLVCQQDDPDPLVAPTLLVRGSPSSPAGTFSVNGEGEVRITYHPRQLQDPASLVATFAHELAHYRTAGFPEPPPGGWEVWEPATDLTAVFLGFGVFLANTRFRFSQFSDGQTMGWQWRQQGYLSEPEILHMHAIFSHLLGLEQEATRAHLKPALRGIFRRVSRDVSAAADALQRLRDTPVASLQDRAPDPLTPA